MYVEDGQMHGFFSKLKKKVKRHVKKYGGAVATVLPGAALALPTKQTATGAAKGLAIGGTIAAGGQAAGALSQPGGFQLPEWFTKAKSFYEENKAAFDAAKQQIRQAEADAKADFVDTSAPPAQASMVGNVNPLLLIGAAALAVTLLGRK